MTTSTAKRTYNCGACGGSGHNKKTCPVTAANPAPKPPKGEVTKLRVIASKDSPKVKKFPKAPKPPKAAKQVVSKAPKPPKKVKPPKPPKAAKQVSPKPPKKAAASQLKTAKSTPNVFCTHDKIESFQDDGGNGIFSECGTCGSRGPCNKTVEAAVAGLKKIKAILPHSKGGIKAGSNTRKKLDGTDKMRGYVLEETQVDIVKKFTSLCEAKGIAKGYSAAMRLLLTNLTETDIKRLAKAPK